MKLLKEVKLLSQATTTSSKIEEEIFSFLEEMIFLKMKN
jgi:hypothetical protein